MGGGGGGAATVSTAEAEVLAVGTEVSGFLKIFECFT
jgi:hypothetical protein